MTGSPDVRLVVSDMDGTLLTSGGVVPDDFWPLLETMRRRGITFVPASGRQYATLARLCRALARRYPIEAIAGHQHIAPGRKHDPGPGFDWRRLQGLLRWSARRFADGALG